MISTATAHFEAFFFFHSGYKPPWIQAPTSTSPPKTPYKVIY